MHAITWKRDLAFYGLGVALLVFYGTQICPFLDTLTTFEMSSVFSVAALMSWGVRVFLLKQILRSPPEEYLMPARVFQIDLGTWVLMGAGALAWNYYVYDFPVPSGLKVVLGTATIGIFSASYLFLKEEGARIESIDPKRQTESLENRKFVSLTFKFSAFVSLIMVFLMGILLLLVYKDFEYVIAALDSQDQTFRFSEVTQEIVFVVALLTIGMIVLVKEFNANIKKLFDKQFQAFERVEKGHYDVAVPFLNHDEFGLVAHHTNKMISGLRDRNRVKEMFGKYLSPKIADAVLKSEEGSLLNGRAAEVTVLFTDMENFAVLSEKLPPRELLTFLNAYFTAIIEIVTKHGGIVDKFVGDALMATFGLDDEGHAPSRAVAASLEIIDSVNRRSFQTSASQQISPFTRAGIHHGKVVAGNVGSEERLEYTVIGDTVNIANRLETLGKKLGAKVVISREVHDHLDPSLTESFEPGGQQEIKGRENPVEVFLYGR